jgi:hypothetical protein
MVGAPGTVAGVPLRAADEGLAPAAFVAVMVHEYAVPFASPVTAMSDGEDTVAVSAAPPAGAQLAVYAVMGEPPFAPDENCSESCAFPGTTRLMVGAVGTVKGVTATLCEAAERPTLFLAFTEQP